MGVGVARARRGRRFDAGGLQGDPARREVLVYVDPAQGATSGIHFKGVLERLGIADAVRAKTQLVAGGYPAEKVASGEAEIVVHQISEIVPVKGVAMIGPLPAELQKVTVYSAGWPRAARIRRPRAPSWRSGAAGLQGEVRRGGARLQALSEPGGARRGRCAAIAVVSCSPCSPRPAPSPSISGR